MADWERDAFREFLGPLKPWIAIVTGLVLFILAYALYLAGAPSVVYLIALVVGAAVMVGAMTYLKGVWISETWDSLRKRRQS